MRHLLPAALAGSLTVALTAPAGAAASPAADAATAAGPSRVALAAALGPVPAATPAKTVADDTYIVRGGDTVSAIAARHGLRTADVLRWNDLGWSSVIYPGQTLRLTGSSSQATSTPAVSTTTAAAKTHTVAAGDTITAIASRYGTTIPAVLAANGLGWSSVIYPGQRISIPGSEMSVPLNAPQTENARLIIAIGREAGVPERGIAIALGTAMQESWLRNLDWGDRDSVGLFQQRPSTGWGTAAQIQDRGYAIRAFFGGPGDPSGPGTRGLLDIPGWESMSFAEAAQAVQISAFPDRYARWEAPAYEWLAALG